jgi:hypothetical protein
MTVGLLKPTVILPTTWLQWSPADRAAVLDHEEEHVRRHDPLILLIALINRAVFWFHPLAWWLHRQIARTGRGVRATRRCCLAGMMRVRTRRVASIRDPDRGGSWTMGPG